MNAITWITATDWATDVTGDKLDLDDGGETEEKERLTQNGWALTILAWGVLRVSAVVDQVMAKPRNERSNDHHRFSSTSESAAPAPRLASSALYSDRTGWHALLCRKLLVVAFVNLIATSSVAVRCNIVDYRYSGFGNCARWLRENRLRRTTSVHSPHTGLPIARWCRCWRCTRLLIYFRIIAVDDAVKASRQSVRYHT